MTCLPPFPAASGAEGKHSERPCSLVVLGLQGRFPSFPLFPTVLVVGRQGRACRTGNASLVGRALCTPTLRIGESRERREAGQSCRTRSSSLGTLLGLQAFPVAEGMVGKEGKREESLGATGTGPRPPRCRQAEYAPAAGGETGQAGGRGARGRFGPYPCRVPCWQAGGAPVAGGEQRQAGTLVGDGLSTPLWGSGGEGGHEPGFARPAEGDERREEPLGSSTSLRLPLGTNECYGGARRRQESTAMGLTTPSANQPRASGWLQRLSEGGLAKGKAALRREPCARSALYPRRLVLTRRSRAARGGRGWPTLPCCPPSAVSVSRSDQHAPSLSPAPVPGSVADAPVKKRVLEGPGLRGTTLGGTTKYFLGYRGVES